MAPRATGFLLAALLCGGPASAHDIWLQADRYRLAPGEMLVVRQQLGEELAGVPAGGEGLEELALLWDLTSRFTLLTESGSTDLLAELRASRLGEKVEPVLERRLRAGGLALVAMDHALIYTEFTDAEFLEYLDHEGFEREHYVGRMASGSFQSEGYRRTLKCLVRVGSSDREGGASDLPGRPLGQTIEILLLQDPYTLDPGDELEVRVLLHGKPLAGQAVSAYHGPRDGTVSRRRELTDGDGVARFVLERPGLWLVRLVHLAPCSPGSGVDCEDTAWESYWAAYTFELDEPQ